MSRAEDIYERLVSGGAAAIDEFIVTRQFEELFLDFKRSADNGKGQSLHEHDRNNFGRALSGFANSEGGVIIWGVDCRSGADGADIARSKEPLVDCDAFASRLEGIVSGCTVPPCPRVRSVAIHSVKGGAAGFVATYVPKSARAPHQQVPDSRYFIRAGSSFLPAPHGVLAGLFGQRPEPFVYHSFLIEPVRCSAESVIDAAMAVVIESDGPGIARDIFVTLDVLSPGRSTSIRMDHESEAFDRFALLHFHSAVIAKESFRLPPGGRIRVFSLTLHLAPPFKYRWSFAMNYGCAGAPTRQHSIRHDPATIQNICRRTADLGEDEGTDFFYRELFGDPGGMLQERQPKVKER